VLVSALWAKVVVTVFSMIWIHRLGGLYDPAGRIGIGLLVTTLVFALFALPYLAVKDPSSLYEAGSWAFNTLANFSTYLNIENFQLPEAVKAVLKTPQFLRRIPGSAKSKPIKTTMGIHMTSSRKF